MKRTLRRRTEPDTRPIIEKMAAIPKDAREPSVNLDLGSQEVVLELLERAEGGMVSMTMDSLVLLCQQHQAEAAPLLIADEAGMVDCVAGTVYWKRIEEDGATVQPGSLDPASERVVAILENMVSQGERKILVAEVEALCKELGAQAHPDAISLAAGRKATEDGAYLWFVPPARAQPDDDVGDSIPISIAPAAERENALAQAMALDADLIPWSDGRDWDEAVVVREILQFGERLILDTYELGRRLIWAKKVIGEKRWGTWCEANLPWAGRQVRSYMQVAAWLQPHQKLLGPAAKLGVRRLVELTRIPPELEQELTEQGTVGGKTLDELAEMPYPEMRDHLKAEKKARALAEDALEHQRKRADDAEKKLQELQAKVGAIRTESSADLGKRLDQAQDRIDLALFDVALILDGAAGRWAELDNQARARCTAMLAYLRDMAQLLDCRHRNSIGEFVAGAEWPDQVLDDGKAPAIYPLPKELMPELREG